MLIFAILSTALGSPNVSLGSHPVVASAASLAVNSSATPLTTPSDQLTLIADRILRTNPHSNCASELTLMLSTGDIIGQFWLGAQRSTNNGSALSTAPTLVQNNFTSGLPIPLNDTLTITNSGSCPIAYTISGHYVQP